MTRPNLASSIVVDRSIDDLDALWDRFEIFEAMHHAQRICNPLTAAGFNRLIELLEPDACTVLDIACGSGELMLRCIEAGATSTVGVDLSPWMLRSAERATRARNAGRQARWILADAARYAPKRRFDRVTCLGGEWVWHGMKGTVSALATLVSAGGRIAYGGPRLHFGADADHVSAQFGQVDTADDVERHLDSCGFDVIERLDPDEQAWLDYLERGRHGAAAWASRHPGERAEQWMAEQREWAQAYDRDRHIVGWSVWVADNCP